MEKITDSDVINQWNAQHHRLLGTQQADEMSLTGSGIELVYALAGHDQISVQLGAEHRFSWIDAGTGTDTLYLPDGFTLVTDAGIICANHAYLITLADAQSQTYPIWFTGIERIQYQGNAMSVTELIQQYYVNAKVEISAHYPYVSSGKTEKLVRNDYAFAFVKTDGSVLVWGDTNNGGSATSVKNLTSVVAVYSNQYSYVAVRSDGSLYAWGNPLYGGDLSHIAADLPKNLSLVNIYATETAFAALYSDGSVMTWGAATGGGDSSGVAGLINGNIPVTNIYASNAGAFAAVRADGSVVTWGNALAGGDMRLVAGELNGDLDVIKVVATDTAFAALRADGSVVTWGYASAGGDSSQVVSALSGVSRDVISLSATQGAFAALLSDQTLVTWGDLRYGGKSQDIQAHLLSSGLSISKLYANDYAFAAILSDGALLTWGGGESRLFGGNLSAVAAQVDGSVDVVSVYVGSRSFAAIKADGTLVSWGVDVSPIHQQSIQNLNDMILSGGVSITQVVANDGAFAALLSNGSVFAWGNANYGGNISTYAAELDGSLKQVVSIHATAKAFAVLYQDQTIFTWGDSSAGGGATSYITQASQIGYVADITKDNALTSGSTAAAIPYTQGSDMGDIFTLTSWQSHQQYDGGAGRDVLILKGKLKDHQVTQLPSGQGIIQRTQADDTTFGVVCVQAIEQVQFDDMLVNLQIADQAALMPEASLQQLIQLYVGFFNRIPESTGLNHWIEQYLSGQSLKAIADRFYEAGVALGVYQAGMSDAGFILKVYDYVLGRSGDTVPKSEEIAYWQAWLTQPQHTKGGMVIQMLNDAYSHFSADPDVGWVVDLLDNKASFAHWYAIDQGLAYLNTAQNISQGNALASRITPTSTLEAVSLVGITPVYRFDDMAG